MAMQRAAMVLRARGGNVMIRGTTVQSTITINTRRAFLSTTNSPHGGPGHESYLGNPEKHDNLFNDKNVTQAQDFEDKSRPLDDPEQNKKLAGAAQAMQDDNAAVGQDTDQQGGDEGDHAFKSPGGEESIKKRAGSESHKLAKDTHHRSNKAGMYEDEVGPDGSPWAS